MLTHLRARGFRNLSPLDWRPGAGGHLILGPNGAGKTSLLEAVYLLATTRSFRTPRLEECARQGEESFHLEAEVESAGRTRLEIGWIAGCRSRTVNGGPAALGEHLGVLPVVSWTADDRELLGGPPAARRRFLDRGVVGLRPAAIEVLGRYRRALAQKRRLLERGGEGLASWNRVLAEAAAELMARRRDFALRLEGALAELTADRDLPLPGAQIRYRPSITGGEGWESVLETLERAGRREREARRPLVGPHRDELELRLAGRGLRGMASAGEKKAFGLALTAARGRVLRQAGRDPLILLDDADAELDRGRLEAVWRAFSGVAQMLVSSSRPEVWGFAGEASRWALDGGVLGPRPENRRSGEKNL